MAGSATGRNALGSTSALIAAFTADRSESRCGLKPAPIESMPMMICVFAFRISLKLLVIAP